MRYSQPLASPEIFATGQGNVFCCRRFRFCDFMEVHKTDFPKLVSIKKKLKKKNIENYSTTSVCMALEGKLFFSRYFVHFQEKVLLVRFYVFFEKSDIIFTWNNTMQLLIRIEFNICNISQLYLYSFILSLCTFQPTLVPRKKQCSY